MSSTDLIYINGIDGSSGDYLLPPMSPEDVSKIAQGEKLDPDHLKELQAKWQAVTEATFGLVEGIDAKDLAATGWGVIFAHDADPALKDALRELLDHRKRQATQKKESYYKEYWGPDGYLPDESKQKFLGRHGAGPGPADPEKVPYYLLIVGDPEAIPYRFQYQLDVQYAVGRIHFDALEDYAQYARSVVASETGEVSLAREGTFFGVRNEDDRATELSADHLITPLAKSMAEDQADWKFRSVLKGDATKAKLATLLGGEETPAFLFTASHGMGFPKADARQYAHQGALLCQDWPGPRNWRKAIPEEHYFSADDIGSNAKVLGLMAFCFACYGAGTPHLDDFAHTKGGQRAEIAPHAFLARLPQRLLSHPKGGALAVVGHVERAWGCSFVWERTGEQLGVFESTLKRLFEGHPIGSAIEYFNERYAELSSDLTSELEEVKYGRVPNDTELSGMWTANNDARSYIIIGDPAVRMPLGENGEMNRPALEEKIVLVSNTSTVNTDPPNPEVAPITETNEMSDDMENDDQELPFSLDLMAEVEARHKSQQETSTVSFDTLGTRAPAMDNPADAVEKRLRRIGMPEAKAKAVVAEMYGSSDLESVVSATTSFAIPSDAIPEELDDETRVGLERILGRNEMIGVTFLDMGSMKAKSVGRIVIRTSPTRLAGYGTGFLIWPSLLMTNNHVLKEPGIAGFSDVQFNYQDNSEGERQTPVEFDLDPDTFFLTSKKLDFTLVAVQEKSKDGQHVLSEFGWNRLSEEPGEILMGESVNIIQHPNGEPKQLALRENRVTGMPEEIFLHYKTDTAPGSSGSPVFNDQWDVVALHHSGVPKKNNEGKILTTSGDVWRKSMGEHKIDWVANEGIRVSAICNHLKAEAFSGAQDTLRKKALNAPDGHALLPKTKLAPAEPVDRPVQSVVGPEMTDAGAVTTNANTIMLNIPLAVTLNLGQPNVVASVVAGSTVSRDEVVDDGAEEEERVQVDQDYSNRKGYNPNFLGISERRVPLPTLSKALEKKASINQQAASAKDPYVLPYHHYSVVMNKKRKLAIYAAVNIDGGKIQHTRREGDRWYIDPRIPRIEQAGAEIYKKNPLDKGHLVRRLDAAWGDTDAIARIGSDDTFHYTNCAPQHADFNRNRSTWAGLENYVFKNADVEDLKVTVFNGPVFDDGDQAYRGVNLPREFWKIVVMVRKSTRKLSATAYLLSQETLIQGLEEEFTFGDYQTFQVPITRIEELTDLDFGDLSDFDPLNDAEFNATESTGVGELTSFEDLVL